MIGALEEQSLAQEDQGKFRRPDFPESYQLFPEDAGEFLAFFMRRVFETQFSVIDQEDQPFEQRVEFVIGQLQALQRLSSIVTDAELLAEQYPVTKDTVEQEAEEQSGSEEVYYFHDVRGKVHVITTYAEMALDSLKKDPTALLHDESTKRMVDSVQLFLVQLMELIEEFKGNSEKEIVVHSRSIKDLEDKIIGFEGTIAIRNFFENREKQVESVNLSYKEKVQALFTGKLKEIQLKKLRELTFVPNFNFNNTANFTKEQKYELKVSFSNALFFRIYDNVRSNTLKAYRKLLEQSYYMTDIEPSLNITTDVRENGIYIVFEDGATGFPLEANDQFHTSEFDGAQCRVYTPEDGKTEWTDDIEGHGDGLAGIAHAIKNDIPGAYLRCLTVLDERRVPKGARVEVFIPFIKN
jgi:hypothetical protein